jgi:diguanylate cyclase (GGDEF)-like protein
LDQTDRRRAVILETYRVLETPPEPAFDDIAALAAGICGTPRAAISLLTPTRQWFKARVGIAEPETPIGDSLCAHTVARGGPELFEVRDAERDSRFAENPLVTGEFGLRFYAGVPLISPDGVGLGALCVIDSRPRDEGLNDLQVRALRTLGDQVVTQLELRRSITERDLHVARHRTNADQLRWLADHDPLTGLANRSLFQARLQEAIDAGEGKHLALLMLDLDHFKQVNDQLGHAAGDGMLKAFAERLSLSVRASDTVARLGGDEFAIILPAIEHPDHIASVTRSIYDRLREPLVFDGRVLDCRTSIGAALYPEHGADADSLTRSADIALYAVKAGGRGNAQVFGADMLANNQRQAAMIARARRAVQQGWIRPHYQPKIDLLSGRVAGFEALLRIEEPGMPIGAPGSILAAFEDMDLANKLGEQMIRQVAADMGRWRRDGIAFGRVAINASVAEFRDPGFADRLLDQLRAADVPTICLELEITETVFLDRETDAVQRALRRLSDAGVRIALDDFGTGYASLSHLQSFPVDVIKADQSFVRNIDNAAGNQAIVKAVLNLGRDLGLETVAEGIETLEQASFVTEHGCCLGQGYLYDRALPADQVPAAVARRAAPEQASNVTRLPTRRATH